METSTTTSTPDLTFLKLMILLPDHHDSLGLFYDHVLDVSHISGFFDRPSRLQHYQTGLKAASSFTASRNGIPGL